MKGGQWGSERGNLKGNSREIIEMAIGIGGVGNLRGGRLVSERGNSKKIQGKLVFLHKRKRQLVSRTKEINFTKEDKLIVVS